MDPNEKDGIGTGENRIDIFYNAKNNAHVADTSRKRQNKAGKNDAVFGIWLDKKLRWSWYFK